MGVPEIIMTGLLALSVATSLYGAGKSKSTRMAVSVLIATGIQVGLLIWGGFYA